MLRSALSQSRRNAGSIAITDAQFNISHTKEKIVQKESDVTPMQFRRFSRDRARLEQTKPVLRHCNLKPERPLSCALHPSLVTRGTTLR